MAAFVSHFTLALTTSNAAAVCIVACSITAAIAMAWLGEYSLSASGFVLHCGVWTAECLQRLIQSLNPMYQGLTVCISEAESWYMKLSDSCSSLQLLAGDEKSQDMNPSHVLALTLDSAISGEKWMETKPSLWSTSTCSSCSTLLLFYFVLSLFSVTITSSWNDIALTHIRASVKYSSFSGNFPSCGHPFPEECFCPTDGGEQSVEHRENQSTRLRCLWAPRWKMSWESFVTANTCDFTR